MLEMFLTRHPIYIYIYIEQAIRERQIPKYLADLLRSFLSQRCILVEEIDESVQNSRRCSAGISVWTYPVKFILLWSIRSRTPEGVSYVGFADNVAMAITSPNTEFIEKKTNLALLYRWMDDRSQIRPGTR